MVSVSSNTNCRTGPGTIYDIVGALLVGEEAEVVGKGEWGYYWIIENPDGAGECWLWNNYATITGPTDGLAVYTPPPTPTPAFDWSGTWTATTCPAEGCAAVLALNLVVTVEEFNFSARFYFEDGQFETYTGTISDDYLSVSGTWTYEDRNGSFTLYALGTNQFNGSHNEGDAIHGLCGAKGGAIPSSSCYRP